MILDTFELSCISKRTTIIEIVSKNHTQSDLEITMEKQVGKKEKYRDSLIGILLTENSVRDVNTLREMEAYKRHYQAQCSHFELELHYNAKRITCAICGRNWEYLLERGYAEKRHVYAAEKDV
jgi:hypothetical protein